MTVIDMSPIPAEVTIWLSIGIIIIIILIFLYYLYLRYKRPSVTHNQK